MLHLGIGNKHDNVQTPPELYEILNNEFHFNFDPCPLNPTQNGLLIDWKSSNFVNPPYSQVQDWIKKGIIEMKKGNLSVFLITARLNTNYWINSVYKYASEIRFVLNRIKFVGYDAGFPIPMAIVIFDPKRTNQTVLIEEGKYKFINFIL